MTDAELVNLFLLVKDCNNCHPDWMVCVRLQKLSIASRDWDVFHLINKFTRLSDCHVVVPNTLYPQLWIDADVSYITPLSFKTVVIIFPFIGSLVCSTFAKPLAISGLCALFQKLCLPWQILDVWFCRN